MAGAGVPQEIWDQCVAIRLKVSHCPYPHHLWIETRSPAPCCRLLHRSPPPRSQDAQI